MDFREIKQKSTVKHWKLNTVLQIKKKLNLI